MTLQLCPAGADRPWAARGDRSGCGGIQGIPSVCLPGPSGWGQGHPCPVVLPECGMVLSRLMTPGHKGLIRKMWVWRGCGVGPVVTVPVSLCPQGGLSAAPSRAVSAVKNINLPEIPRNINIGDINIKVPNLSQFM